MANIALESASSALSSLNTKLDVIANNLANVNTTGFKASRVNFQDLLYLERQQPGTENAHGDQRPIGLYVGLGVRVAGTQVNFEQGTAIDTGRELDLMIESRGFFRVRYGDELAYTRAGHFTLNSEGEMVLANDTGRRLEPNILVPEDASSVTIDETGRVFAAIPGAAEPEELGQIEIMMFINPAGLKQVGESLFMETAASGNPIEGVPGTDGLGRIIQSKLEASNVDPTRELVDLIRTQRAFEMNSQSIRAADESLRTVAQLRR
jgi:flagellar basal-body rod protein FlgG